MSKVLLFIQREKWSLERLSNLLKVTLLGSKGAGQGQAGIWLPESLLLDLPMSGCLDGPITLNPWPATSRERGHVPGENLALLQLFYYKSIRAGRLSWSLHFLRQDNLHHLSQTSSELTHAGDPSFTFLWICNQYPHTASHERHV